MSGEKKGNPLRLMVSSSKWKERCNALQCRSGPWTDNVDFSDNNKESSAESSLLFAMSGDGQSDVTIPIVFLFFKEGQRLLEAAYEYPELQVLLTYTPKNNGNLDFSFNDYQMHSACCCLIDIFVVNFYECITSNRWEPSKLQEHVFEPFLYYIHNKICSNQNHTGSKIYRIVVSSSRTMLIFFLHNNMNIYWRNLNYSVIQSLL